MTDPLEPEIVDAASAGVPDARGTVDAIAAAVERTVPGRTVRVEVEERAAPRSQMQQALQPLPRFRISIDGTNGPIAVESGPLFSCTVSFKHARFGFDLSRAFASRTEDARAAALTQACADIAARVRAFAADELIVLEEQRGPRLLRVNIVRLERGRVVEVVESAIVPSAGDVGPAHFESFGGTVRGAPTKEQARAVDKLTGGVLGKMKRKLGEKLFAAAAKRLTANFERADGTADDGRRKLGD